MPRIRSIRKVYLLNQNYAFGKSFQAAANQLIKTRASGVEIVGDELIVPFGKVQDFTPYVAKIKASGADTIVTGNWGADLVRLVKATVGSGLDAQYYTVYGGVVSSIAGYGGDALKVKMKQVNEVHENHPDLSDAVTMTFSQYRKKYNDTWYGDRYRWLLEMLTAAIEKAGSADPIKVAFALEGMTHPGAVSKVTMRADDHQIQMPLVVSTLTADAPKSVMSMKTKISGSASRPTVWPGSPIPHCRRPAAMKRPKM